MIEYCLESAECDPDIEIQSMDQLKISDENEEEAEEKNDENEDEEEEEKYETPEETNQPSSINNEKSDLKLKETSIFSLLSTIPFIDTTEKHPLEIFLKKTKNLNVLHHKTHRTPLLESIYFQQIQTSQMLINNSLCDINLSTSNLSNEQKQTPLIFACKLQLLSIIRSLLEHKKCNIASIDYENNQAIHYYLQTSNRSNEYLDILKIFIKKLTFISNDALNIQGKFQRTPLHIAVYHNLGTIDAITDIEKVLIENGSDLLMKDNLGNLPLHNVFLNKKIGDDPVELCVLIIKSMKYKSIDTKNNQGDTSLHLAVVSVFLSLNKIKIIFLFIFLRQNVL
jgi:ankyrin repeat protein